MCLTVLVSCSAASNTDEAKGAYENSYETSYEDVYTEEAVEAEEPDMAYESSDSFSLAEGTGENEKIVWTGSVSMQTMQWDQTLQELGALFEKYGVQVMNASENTGSYSYYSSSSKMERYCSYELRVPSDNFKAFFDGFDGISGLVTSSNKYRTDMTKVYNDNSLRIELLQTEYDELNELMGRAETVDEILEIRDRMTEVLYELQSLQNANNTIDYDVDYSFVSLYLQEVVIYETEDVSFGTRISYAIQDGWEGFVETLQDILIFILESLPFLIVFVALPIVIVIIVVKRIRKNKKQKKAPPEEPEKKDDKQ